MKQKRYFAFYTSKDSAAILDCKTDEIYEELVRSFETDETYSDFESRIVSRTSYLNHN